MRLYLALLELAECLLLVADDLEEGALVQVLLAVEFDDAGQQGGDDVVEHLVVVVLLGACREAAVY